MFYCKYGQLMSDEKGLFMKCPHDCHCDVTKGSPERSTHPLAVILGVIVVCALFYGLVQVVWLVTPVLIP